MDIVRFHRGLQAETFGRLIPQLLLDGREVVAGFRNPLDDNRAVAELGHAALQLAELAECEGHGGKPGIAVGNVGVQLALVGKGGARRGGGGNALQNLEIAIGGNVPFQRDRAIFLGDAAYIDRLDLAVRLLRLDERGVAVVADQVQNAIDGSLIPGPLR